MDGPLRFHQRSRLCFTRMRGEIARSNLTMLRRVSAAFELFLLLYGIIAALVFQNTQLDWYYRAFAVLNLPLTVCFYWYGRRRPPSFPLIQAACILTVVLVLGFTICICIFPYPARPAIFFPLAYMLVTVLFTLPLWQIALTLTLETGIYLAGVWLIKSPEAWPYDFAGALTTWALGFFFLYWVTDLRMRDAEARLALEELSRTDPLTGLPNRRAMEEDVARGYRRCQRAGLSVAMAMLDVDDFKDFNDRFGHPAGDRCLKALGDILGAFAAEQGVLAARYGGEEFLLFLPGSTREDGVALAQAFLERVHGSGLHTPDGAPVTLSIGVAAELPPETGTHAQLLKRADEALYRAKSAGKDRVAAHGCAGPT